MTNYDQFTGNRDVAAAEKSRDGVFGYKTSGGGKLIIICHFIDDLGKLITKKSVK